MQTLEKVPRVRLINLPTPLEALPRLTKKLSGPRLWIKRDDKTGLAFGGNKARKLEYLMGDAKHKDADFIITTGSPQSNHARMTVAAANKLGMDTLLVLKGKKPRENQGNLLLDRILGADIKFADVKTYDDVHKIMAELAVEYARKGHKPYTIPVGGANYIGTFGYLNAIYEIVAQAKQLGIKTDYIVHSTSTGATQAGLVLGAKILDPNLKILGIGEGSDTVEIRQDAIKLANEAAKKLDIDISVGTKDIIIYDDRKYAGEGYGIPSKECIEAIKLLARAEGILLDPVYTSKAMVGLLDLIEKGKFAKDQNVVFLHTGGAPALFAFRKELEAQL